MTQYKKQAQNLASKGRYGDSVLVHMNEEEVGALHGLASLAGRELTTNPDTGMPEAFNLFDILPFALNFIFPGMGTAAQIGIGALSGAASGAIEGEDPLMAALTGGAMSGIGSALFGGASPGEDALAAIGGGDMSGLSKEALATVAQGPLGPGVMESALPKADSLLGGVSPKIQNWLDNPLSNSNMPWTLAGGAALASLMPAQGLGEDLENPQDGKAHLRNPAAPRPYQPLNTPDLNTYGQLGSDYQSEVNYFLNNPGPYTGSPYEGDPYAYPFKDGGMVHKGGGLACYADGGMISGTTIPKTGNVILDWLRNQNENRLYINNLRSQGAGMPTAAGMSADPGMAQAQAMPVPASLAGMQPVNTSSGRRLDSVGGMPRVPRVPQGRGRDNNVSAPGFISPPRQILPQQPATTQASVMPGSQPTITPALFSAPRFADGGIAGIPGAVDPNIIGQLMGGAREVPGEDMGMDDSIPAAIDGAQPAKLSSGEVVIPADVVSMLGDGNTRAGAAILRQMVERVRMQKTGTPSQSDPVDLEGSLPA